MSCNFALSLGPVWEHLIPVNLFKWSKVIKVINSLLVTQSRTAFAVCKQWQHCFNDDGKIITAIVKCQVINSLTSRCRHTSPLNNMEKNQHIEHSTHDRTCHSITTWYHRQAHLHRTIHMQETSATVSISPKNEFVFVWLNVRQHNNGYYRRQLLG
jgi:hypothetical protein